MTNINIKMTKDMSEDQIKLARREYMRQYMAKRRAEDPEFQEMFAKWKSNELTNDDMIIFKRRTCLIEQCHEAMQLTQRRPSCSN